MKKFILDARPFNKDYVTTALESGADAIISEKEHTAEIKELGIIDVISENGDMRAPRDIEFFTIQSKDDERAAAKAGKTKPIVVDAADWKIIPLENLIAQVNEIYVYVDSKEDVETLSTVLEKGVDGIVLKPKSVNQVVEIAALIKKSDASLPLTEIEIDEVRQLGLGDRVCIDTIANMKPGEGMLVGNASSGFFLVHSESIDNPYVNARPFRVNAGGVHCYILLPNDRTSYLSELQTGDSVLITNKEGNTSVSYVGRIKQEKRPMLLVSGNVSGEKISVILQNAETIRLVSAAGEPVSVVKLKKGMRVMGYVTSGGRHFGMSINETIVEK